MNPFEWSVSICNGFYHTSTIQSCDAFFNDDRLILDMFEGANRCLLFARTYVTDIADGTKGAIGFFNNSIGLLYQSIVRMFPAVFFFTIC